MDIGDGRERACRSGPSRDRHQRAGARVVTASEQVEKERRALWRRLRRRTFMIKHRRLIMGAAALFTYACYYALFAWVWGKPPREAAVSALVWSVATIWTGLSGRR